MPVTNIIANKEANNTFFISLLVLYPNLTILSNPAPNPFVLADFLPLLAFSHAVSADVINNICPVLFLPACRSGRLVTVISFIINDSSLQPTLNTNQGQKPKTLNKSTTFIQNYAKSLICTNLSVICTIRTKICTLGRRVCTIRTKICTIGRKICTNGSSRGTDGSSADISGRKIYIAGTLADISRRKIYVAGTLTDVSERKTDIQGTFKPLAFSPTTPII